MRKVISLLASLALVASLMAVTAAPVAAADYGPCRDDSTRYFVAGENFSATGLYGVEAYINPASGFHMCTPAESSITDQNASVIQVALIPDGSAPNEGFMVIGIVMCDGPSVGAPSFCKGYPGSKRFFGEYLNWTGSWWLGDGQWDLGAADMAPHRYRIYWDGDEWLWTIDGVVKLRLGGILAGVTPADGWKAQVQAETHDRGDGVGGNVDTPSKVYSVYTRNSSGTWTSRSFGDLCSYGDNQAEISFDCAGSEVRYWSDGN